MDTDKQTLTMSITEDIDKSPKLCMSRLIVHDDYPFSLYFKHRLRSGKLRTRYEIFHKLFGTLSVNDYLKTAQVAE